MTTKEELVEQKLTKACDEAIAEGWKISQYAFVREDEKACCVIGSIGRFADNVTPWVSYAATKLDLDYKDIWQIVNGFDGNESVADDHFYAIGARLREKYLKEKNS